MQQVNFAIQNGCKLSRATVHKFRHNDVGDLERVLQQVDRHHRAARCLAIACSLSWKLCTASGLDASSAVSKY